MLELVQNRFDGEGCYRVYDQAGGRHLYCGRIWRGRDGRWRATGVWLAFETLEEAREACGARARLRRENAGVAS